MNKKLILSFLLLLTTINAAGQIYEDEPIYLFDVDSLLLGSGVSGVTNLSWDDPLFMEVTEYTAANMMVNIPAPALIEVNIVSDGWAGQIGFYDAGGGVHVLALNVTAIDATWDRITGRFRTNQSYFRMNGVGVGDRFRKDSYILMDEYDYPRIWLNDNTSLFMWAFNLYRRPGAPAHNYSHALYMYPETFDTFYELEQINENQHYFNGTFTFCSSSGILWVECWIQHMEEDGSYGDHSFVRDCGRWYNVSMGDYSVEKNPAEDTIELDVGETSVYRVLALGVEIDRVEWELSCSAGVLDTWETDYGDALALYGLGDGVYLLTANLIGICGETIISEAWILDVQSEGCHNTYRFYGIDDADNDFPMNGTPIRVYQRLGDIFAYADTYNTNNESEINGTFACLEEYEFRLNWSNGTLSCSANFTRITPESNEWYPFWVLCSNLTPIINITVNLENELSVAMPGEIINLYRGHPRDERLIDNCITNASGSCVFQVSAVGDYYAVKFEKTGYLTETFRFLLTDDLEINLTARLAAEMFNIRIRTLNQDGDRIQGVQCVLRNLLNGTYLGYIIRDNITEYSRGAGICDFTVEGYYGYIIDFSHYSHHSPPSLIIDNLTSDREYDIYMDSIGQMTNLNIVVVYNGTEGDDFLEGAKVRVTGEDATDTVDMVLYTDKDGLARFMYLPIGNYVITASKAGYEKNTARGYYDDPSYYIRMELGQSSNLGEEEFWEEMDKFIWNGLLMISLLIVFVLIVKLADSM